MFTPVMFKFTSIGNNCDNGCDWTWARDGVMNKESTISAGKEIAKNKRRGSETE